MKIKKIISIVLLISILVGCSASKKQPELKISNIFTNESNDVILILANGDEYNLGKLTLEANEVSNNNTISIDAKDGKDGINGKNGIDGKDGIDGKNGIDGKDGTLVTISDSGELLLNNVGTGYYLSKNKSDDNFATIPSKKANIEDVIAFCNKYNIAIEKSNLYLSNKGNDYSNIITYKNEPGILNGISILESELNSDLICYMREDAPIHDCNYILDSLIEYRLSAIENDSGGVLRWVILPYYNFTCSICSDEKEGRANVSSNHVHDYTFGIFTKDGNYCYKICECGAKITSLYPDASETVNITMPTNYDEACSLSTRYGFKINGRTDYYTHYKVEALPETGHQAGDITIFKSETEYTPGQTYNFSKRELIGMNFVITEYVEPDPLQIYASPIKEVYLPGDTIQLTCSLSNQQHFWYIQDDFNYNGITISADGLVTIPNYIRDNGTFTVKVELDDGSFKTKSFSVQHTHEFYGMPNCQRCGAPNPSYN